MKGTRAAGSAIDTGQPNLGNANLTWTGLSTARAGYAKDHGIEHARNQGPLHP